MASAGKQQKHKEKMKKKRAAKSAKREKYKNLAGTSKKSKRQKSKVRTSGIYKNAHIMSDCGNPGCKKCYPNLGLKKKVG